LEAESQRGFGEAVTVTDWPFALGGKTRQVNLVKFRKFESGLNLFSPELVIDKHN
jgi:hypothetical protein